MTDQRTPSRRPLVVPQPEMTLAEVASALGVTKERVRQLECRALLKLRKQLHRRGFEREDFFD